MLELLGERDNRAAQQALDTGSGVKPSCTLKGLRHWTAIPSFLTSLSSVTMLARWCGRLAALGGQLAGLNPAPLAALGGSRAYAVVKGPQQTVRRGSGCVLPRPGVPVGSRGALQ